DIQQIVRGLAAEGIGILVTDHNVRETLKITERSYLIKDGQVRTHGTPRHIINDPIAINEYLGQTFNDSPLLGPIPAAAAADKPAEAVVHQVVEQEKVVQLIERLKTDSAAAAAAELVQRGMMVLPALIEALERRDVELRRTAFEVLQKLVG